MARLRTDANGNLICAADNGGDGSGAAGADGSVQFASGGSLTADSNFVWDNANQTLAVTGTTTADIFVATNTTATSTFPYIYITGLRLGTDYVTDLPTGMASFATATRLRLIPLSSLLLLISMRRARSQVPQALSRVISCIGREVYGRRPLPPLSALQPLSLALHGHPKCLYC